MSINTCNPIDIKFRAIFFNSSPYMSPKFRILKFESEIKFLFDKFLIDLIKFLKFLDEYNVPKCVKCIFFLLSIFFFKIL